MISMAKLDLPWLKKDRQVQPGRYLSPEARERRLDAARQRRDKRGTVAAPYMMPDIDSIYGGSWKSIIDGSEISSRSNRREMEIRAGDSEAGPIINVGDRYWAEDGDDVRRTEELMGYDKSLIGDPSFRWGPSED